MIIENIRHIDVPDEEYHVRPAVSHSMLKLLPEDPESYWAKFVAKPKPKWAEEPTITRPMELGTAFHAILLEGKKHPIVPLDCLASNGAMTTNAAKAFKAAYPDYLKPDEHDALDYAVKRCWRDPEVAAYLRTNGHVEFALEWRDANTGIDCRGKLDKLCRFADGWSVLDVKFSGGCTREWVEKQVAAMSYYRQAAMYADAAAAYLGEPIASFAFLFVKNDGPYNNGLWILNSNDIDLGRRHNDAALADLKRRREQDDWFVLSPPGGNYFTISESFAGKRLWERDTDSINFQADFAAFASTN